MSDPPPRRAASHRAKAMTDDEIDRPWTGPADFVVWRARQLWAMRAWRLLAVSVLLAFMTIGAIAERDLSAVPSIALGVGAVAAWFVAPPVVADAARRVAHLVRRRRGE